MKKLSKAVFYSSSVAVGLTVLAYELVIIMRAFNSMLTKSAPQLIEQLENVIEVAIVMILIVGIYALVPLFVLSAIFAVIECRRAHSIKNVLKKPYVFIGLFGTVPLFLISFFTVQLFF